MALDAAERPVTLGAMEERQSRPSFRRPTTEGPVAKTILIALALGFLALFLVLPLVAVFIEAFRKDGWDIVRPRDPEAPLRVGFAGTPAYDPDPRWRIAGRWLPYPAPRSVRIGSIQERLGGPVDSPGEVEFELDGRVHRLVAVPAHGAPGSIALLFRDRTSGVTTYPAQRELLVALPESGDAVVLDFTRAANKNCAYTDFAVCPLPPAGNTLDVAIEAGERIPYGRLES